MPSGSAGNDFYRFKGEHHDGPTLAQVIEVVRKSSGEHRKPIDSNTLIEAGLHICGMDGEDLLEDCEEAFGVQLATEEDGYMNTFSRRE
jgi:hypothetical protein